MDEVLKKIQDTEGQWYELFSRMDTDKGHYHLTPFTIKDKNNRPMKNVTNVTLNDAQTYASRVIATLIGAEMQTIVEGANMDDKATSLIEDFLRDAFLAADERLSKRDITSLKAFHVEQSCIRGRLVSRCLLWQEGDQFVADLLPCDSRFVVYGIGLKGLKWIAYKTVRTAEQVEEEYGITARSEKPVVWDHWDDRQEIVFVDDKRVKEQRNSHGYPPFVVTNCQSGSMLQDEDAFAHTAESIFFSNRSLYEPLNRAVSIVGTEAAKMLKGPMQYRSQKGELAHPPRPAYGEGEVIPVELQGGFDNMPYADRLNFAKFYYAIIDARIQRGGLPAVDYGNLTFPLSAVAITRLTATKDMIFLPRLQALSVHYRDLSRMLIKQYIDGKFRADLGDEGEKKRFAAADLKGDYSIKYQFQATSPEQNVANYSIAEAASRWLSDDTIVREILQRDNPEEERRKRWVEMAERDEFLAYYNMAKALIEDDREIEAMVAASKIGLSLNEIKAGKISAREQNKAVTTARPQGKPVLPLMPPGAGRRTGGQAQPSPEQIAEEV